jgi:hypothetical protein
LDHAPNQLRLIHPDLILLVKSYIEPCLRLWHSVGDVLLQRLSNLLQGHTCYITSTNSKPYTVEHDIVGRCCILLYLIILLGTLDIRTHGYIVDARTK